eukprot:UN3360
MPGSLIMPPKFAAAEMYSFLAPRALASATILDQRVSSMPALRKSFCLPPCVKYLSGSFEATNKNDTSNVSIPLPIHCPSSTTAPTNTWCPVFCTSKAPMIAPPRCMHARTRSSMIHRRCRSQPSRSAGLKASLPSI